MSAAALINRLKELWTWINEKKRCLLNFRVQLLCGCQRHGHYTPTTRQQVRLIGPFLSSALQFFPHIQSKWIPCSSETNSSSVFFFFFPFFCLGYCFHSLAFMFRRRIIGMHTSVFKIWKWRKTERILDCNSSVYIVCFLCVCAVGCLCTQSETRVP